MVRGKEMWHVRGTGISLVVKSEDIVRVPVDETLVRAFGLISASTNRVPGARRFVVRSKGCIADLHLAYSKSQITRL